MKAFLKNYRQSPRKVRLLADLVRGKAVNDALTTLEFTTKRASDPVTKLIKSAVANAKSEGVDTNGLYIKSIVVDKGTVFKRFKARARGSAAGINKRNSHVTVELGTRGKEKKASVKKAKAKKKETKA